MKFLLPLKEKIQKILSSPFNIKGDKKENFKPIIFSTEQLGTYKFYSLAAIVILILGLAISASAVKNTKIMNTLKVKAATMGVGSYLFCGSRKLCQDGKCEGESWSECESCPPGKARAIMEIECGNYLKSACILEKYNCND